MPLYVNLNPHAITIDLGNPSRRNVTVEPFARAAQPGVVRVLALDHRKASTFVQINMLALAPASVKEADVDGIAIEAAAVEATRARFNRTPSPEVAESTRARREQAAADFRRQEAAAVEDLRAREAARAAKAPTVAAAVDRAKGIIAEQPAQTRVTDPDAETSTDLEPVEEAGGIAAINAAAELKPGEGQPVIPRGAAEPAEGEQGHNTED